MNTILIIADRQEDFTQFSSNFSHLPIHFSMNNRMESALEAMAFEQPFIIFLVSKNTEQMMEWLNLYESSTYQIPLVAFTAGLDWAEREMLWKSGVSDIVELPRSKKELEYIIKAFLIHPNVQDIQNGNQMKGRLQDLGVVDIIRTFSSGEKSGEVFLEKGLAKGQIEFNKGKLVNANLLECDPLEAVMVMSNWKEGLFVSRNISKKTKEKIVLDNEQIIKECLNYQENYRKNLKALPAWDIKLYSDPDIEYEEFGPKDREILQQFRTGYTLDQFMNEYDGNWNFILKKFILWLDRGWFLMEDAFSLIQAKRKADERKSALRKTFDKIFSKKDAEVLQSAKKKEKEDYTSTVLEDEQKQQSLFTNREFISTFEVAKNGVLEIPLIIADDEEELLFTGTADFELVPGKNDLTFYEHQFNLSKSVIFYKIKNLFAHPNLADYDPLFNKVPFMLLLFKEENAMVQTIMRRLGQRFDTPLFFLSSSEASLKEISNDKLIKYDSGDENRMENAAIRALGLYLS